MSQVLSVYSHNFKHPLMDTLIPFDSREAMRLVLFQDHTCCLGKHTGTVYYFNYFQCHSDLQIIIIIGVVSAMGFVLRTTSNHNTAVIESTLIDSVSELVKWISIERKQSDVVAVQKSYLWLLSSRISSSLPSSIIKLATERAPLPLLLLLLR